MDSTSESMSGRRRGNDDCGIPHGTADRRHGISRRRNEHVGPVRDAAKHADAATGDAAATRVDASTHSIDQVGFT